jgi:hypothetical protein
VIDRLQTDFETTKLVEKENSYIANTAMIKEER